MANVTISYKGSTLAAMSASGSKTLLTKGKYCEDDFGIAYAWEPLNWMGEGAEFVQEFYRSKFFLKDTNYPSWTPSTTAETIKATENLSVISIDLATYEYMIEWTWDMTAAYPAGQTLKTTLDRQIGAIYQTAHRRPYGLANFAAENYAYNYVTALNTNAGYLIYYNSNGTKTWTTGNSYGIYPSSVLATLSSTSADTVNLTPKTPDIKARCYSSYFSTTRAAEIDQDNTQFVLVGRLYRMRLGSCALRNMYGKAIDIYNHPLTAP